VPWEYHHDARVPLRMLQARGYQIAALETAPRAEDLFDWQPRWPVCVLFGNEVDGIGEDLLAACDVFVRLPMLGRKHSLNVATAGGVVAYELLRKYRRLREEDR
jgi:tRNA G18 (ribose-2'-O)-methylase SpoU